MVEKRKMVSSGCLDGVMCAEREKVMQIRIRIPYSSVINDSINIRVAMICGEFLGSLRIFYNSVSFLFIGFLVNCFPSWSWRFYDWIDI